MRSTNKTLDDFDLDAEEYVLIKFDGRNWEEAVAKLNEKLGSSNQVDKDASL